MPQHHQTKSRRPQFRQRVPRFKRPLVILTYLGNQLESIHSSTPTVQFVRLDLQANTSTDAEAAEFPPAGAAHQLLIPALTELPEEFRLAAQRAFRRS